MSAQSFTVSERVLCYHGPLIYEAKLLKAETWDESTTQTGVVGPHYYVHYKGWKQTCVPFVPPSSSQLAYMSYPCLCLSPESVHALRPCHTRVTGGTSG